MIIINLLKFLTIGAFLSLVLWPIINNYGKLSAVNIILRIFGALFFCFYIYKIPDLYFTSLIELKPQNNSILRMQISSVIFFINFLFMMLWCLPLFFILYIFFVPAGAPISQVKIKLTFIFIALSIIMLPATFLVAVNQSTMTFSFLSYLGWLIYIIFLIPFYLLIRRL